MNSRFKSFKAGSLLRLALFALIAPFAVAYGFLLHSAGEAKELLQHFGYFAMTATFLWWLASLVVLARREPAVRHAFSIETARLHLPALGLIAVFMAVAWCTVPYSFKVLYDEAVLQSTAFNLHFFREFGTVIRGYEINGMFTSLTVYLDKRPFFYPYLVSLVHDLTGYRVLNAYVLNTVLLPVVLALVYVVTRALGGTRGALVALALFGASPLLAENANGSGMEMLNIAMFLATLGLAVHYLNKPDEARLSALVLTCVLLAQTRYESALYVGCVGVLILEGWRRAGRVILPLAGLCAPLLLVPSALHNVYLSGTPVLWELNSEVNSRFSGQHFLKNIGHAAAYFYELSPSLKNAVWLSVAGALAIVWALWGAWRHRRVWKLVPPGIIASWVMGLGVAANLGLLMFYFWGQLDDPIVSRLALPMYVMLAVAVAWAVGRCRLDWQPRVGAWLIAGALLGYLAVGLRAIAYNNGLNQLATEMSWEEHWVARRPSVPRLMITNKTGLNWFAQSTAAIAVELARGKAEQVRFHMNAGTFREVLVSQYYRPVGAEGGFVLDPRDALPDSFVLEPLIERQMGGRLLRISRVVEIRLPRPAPAAAN